uniref:Uncharacterized protein n=1 Tax=Salmo trutta TaxID=8032 RepID=A0A674AIH1_SALTR
MFYIFFLQVQVQLSFHLQQSQCCPCLCPSPSPVLSMFLSSSSSVVHVFAHHISSVVLNCFLSPDAVPSPIPSPAVPVLSMSLPRLLCSLLVGSPYLLVTIILLVKYCRSRAQGETRVPRKTHQDQLGDHVEEE